MCVDENTSRPANVRVGARSADECAAAGRSLPVGKGCAFFDGMSKVVSVMPKKIPMRQCLGCREHKPKSELIRVVRAPEGEISLDFRGKKPGRGAYLCPRADCLARVRKSRGLERAFSCQVAPEVYEALEEQMKAGERGDG